MADDNPFKNYQPGPRAPLPGGQVENPFQGYQDAPETTIEEDPPPQTRGTLESILRMPALAARGALSGTLGMPADLINLALYGTYLARQHVIPRLTTEFLEDPYPQPEAVPGQPGQEAPARPVEPTVAPTGNVAIPPQVPGGSDWMKRRYNEAIKLLTGYDLSQGETTMAERAAETLGTFAGPGGALKAGGRGPRTLAPGTSRVLEAVGGTPRANVIQGGGAVAGGEVARSLPTETGDPNERAQREALGQAIGAVGTGLVHGVTDYAMQAAKARGAVRSAEEGLETATQGLRDVTAEQAAITDPLAEELFRRTQERNAAVRGATRTGRTERRLAEQREADVQTALEGEQAQLGAEEAARLAALAPPQAQKARELEALGGQRTRALQEQRAAQMAQGTEFAGAEQVLAPVAPTIGTVPTGAQLQATLATETSAQRAQRVATETRMMRRLETDIGPKLDNAALLDVAQRDYRPKFIQARNAANDAMDVVEELTVDAMTGVALPVVPTGVFRERLRELILESERRKVPLPDEFYRYAEQGVDIRSLSDEQREILAGMNRNERGLQMLAWTPDDYALDMATARAIERELGAGGRGELVGSLGEGRYRTLNNAIAHDMQTFFDTAAGAESGTALATARDQWKRFRTTFNETILRDLLDTRAGYAPQGFVPFFYSVNAKNFQQLQDIWNLAAPETRAAISHHIAARMARLSERRVGGTPQIVGTLLERQLYKLQDQGTLGIYFTPEQQSRMWDLVQRMTAAEPTLDVGLRRTMTRIRPEQVPGFVFKPGDFSTTYRYKRISTPETFRDARSAWADDFLRSGLTPEQMASTIEQMSRVQRHGASQLSLMFTDQPGVADGLQAMAREFRANTQRARSAGFRAANLQDQIARTEAMWDTHIAQVDATAQRRIDAVTDRVEDLQAQLARAKEQTTRVERTTGETVADIRSSAQVDTDRLQALLRDAEQVARREIAAVQDTVTSARDAVAQARANAQQRPALWFTAGLPGSIMFLGGVHQLLRGRGLAAAGTQLALGGATMALGVGAEALIRSRVVQHLARNWNPQQYSPASIRFATSVLGEASARALTPPEAEEVPTE